MLAFLHTSPVHVETFQRLVSEMDAAIPIRHEVREQLLARVRAAGAMTEAVRAEVADAIRMLAGDGAKLIVCTCSTIGAIAEAAPVSEGVLVMRIDRPMAEQAVASGRRIIVLAALASTLAPTMGLVREVAARAGRAVDVLEVLSETAWPFFERGAHADYAAEIARTIEAVARPGDLVLLAQASMAPAADVARHLNIPILSSPRLGVEAALARYRAMARLHP